MKLKLNFRPLPVLLYTYMTLPFMIFSFFMKIYFAIPVFLIVVFCTILASSDSDIIAKIEVSPHDKYKIMAGCLFILAIVALSGIGGLLWQNQDHPFRNGIFNMLVERSWPPTGQNASGDSVALCYYIGFWLPSAVVGKLIGLSAGYVFQMIWASLGIGLIWLLLCRLHKKVVLYPLVIIMLFSGLDRVGYLIVTNLFKPTVTQIGNWASFGGVPPFAYHLEWWPKFYQFSSNLTQLFWVFNQSLPVWLATLVLICEKNNKNLVFIMGVTLLSSTMPFVGLIPIFFWCAFTKHTDSVFERPLIRHIDSAVFPLFTIQNIFGGGVSGILSFLYLRGNIASSAAASSAAKASSFSFLPFAVTLVLLLFVFFLLYKKSFGNPAALVAALPILIVAYKFASLDQTKMIYYILFILFEVLIIAALIFPRYGQTSIYYIVIFSLMVIPFFKVGKSIDFCMRASIPALFVLSVMTAFSVTDYYILKKKVLFSALIIVLSVGALTPAHEIARTVINSSRAFLKDGRIEKTSKSINYIFNGANFTAKTDSGVFFKYLAK